MRELLEFEEDTAGGLMNTEYVALHDNATVVDAMAALKGNEDLLETLNTLFLIDEEERLTAAIPLARLFLARGETPAQGTGRRDSDPGDRGRNPGPRHRVLR